MSERIYHGYPFDWIEMPLNEVCSIVDYRGKTPTKVDEGILLVTAKNIMLGSIDYEISREFIKEDDFEEVMRRGYAEIGDVLYTTEAPLGNVAQVDRSKIALAQRVVKFSGNDSLDNTYLKYFMMSEDFRNHIDKQATGSTVKGIKGSRLKVSPVAIPPLPEQKKIAKILSSVDGHIDEVDGMIEDLKELKKGLMQKLLTEGIGHTEFKDSVVGRIPVEWEVKTLGEITDIKIGGTPSRKVKEYWDENLETQNTWVSIKDLSSSGKYIDFSSERISDLGISKSNVKLIPKGTVLMSFKLTIGVTAITDKELYTNEAIAAFDIDDEVLDTQFLYYSIPYLQYETDVAVKGATLNKQKLNDAFIAVPTLTEQKKIADILSDIDEHLEIYSEEKIDLSEMKKGLMQQLLTGKTRVKIDN